MIGSVRMVTVHISLALTALLFAGFTVPAHSSERLDLFDAQGNHLMFVVFENGADGTPGTRTVYMSDSTFVRRVVTVRDGQGNVLRETSLNFNEDTIFSTACSANGTMRSMTVHDQFGMDELGGPVSYQSPAPGEYVFSQRGTEINRMTYDYDDQGQPVKISVTDRDGSLLYYGTFSRAGAALPRNRLRDFRPAVSLSGGRMLSARFTVTKPSVVRCELIALDGRHAGALFDGIFPAGLHRKNIRIASPSCAAAQGVYLVVLSIDGKTVASDRLLLLPVSGGSGL